MSTIFDVDDTKVRERMRLLSTESLLKVINEDYADYSEQGLGIARQELALRGIYARNDVKQVAESEKQQVSSKLPLRVLEIGVIILTAMVVKTLDVKEPMIGMVFRPIIIAATLLGGILIIINAVRRTIYKRRIRRKLL